MSKSSTVDHHFLIAPVSAQAHIKHNRSEQPLRSKSQPRVVCDLHLEQVPLSLVDVRSYYYSFIYFTIKS